MQRTINGAILFKCRCHKLSAGAFQSLLVLPVACSHLPSPPTAVLDPRCLSWAKPKMAFLGQLTPGNPPAPEWQESMLANGTADARPQAIFS